MIKKIAFSLALLIVNNVYSQVVHTAITPNFEINLSQTPGSGANLFPIDFNNDGSIDFNFRWDVYGAGNYFMHITSSSTYNPNNQMIGKGTVNSYNVPYAKVLTDGTPISPSSSGWITESRGPIISDGQDSNFLGLGDRYIGVRFLSGGQYYYGWILVSFLTNKLIIKSYAYQTSPDTAISAGDTGGSLSVDNYKFGNSIKIYPNPTSEYIEVAGLKNNIPYKIYNLEGDVIKNGVINISRPINVSELIKGSYILSLETNKQKDSFKFIKK